MMQVEAPDEYVGALPALFLAGGITGCPDWQGESVRLLAAESVAVLNPRRADFPMDDPTASAGQVAWEFRHLQRADVVLFWFPDSGAIVQPIALYELGFHASAGKPLAVGADLGYARRRDVVLQLGHVRPELTVYDSLAATVAQARTLLTSALPQVGGS